MQTLVNPAAAPSMNQARSMASTAASNDNMSTLELYGRTLSQDEVSVALDNGQVTHLPCLYDMLKYHAPEHLHSHTKKSSRRRQASSRSVGSVRVSSMRSLGSSVSKH